MCHTLLRTCNFCTNSWKSWRQVALDGTEVLCDDKEIRSTAHSCMAVVLSTDETESEMDYTWRWTTATDLLMLKYNMRSFLHFNLKSLHFGLRGTIQILLFDRGRTVQMAKVHAMSSAAPELLCWIMLIRCWIWRSFQMWWKQNAGGNTLTYVSGVSQQIIKALTCGRWHRGNISLTEHFHAQLYYCVMACK